MLLMLGMRKVHDIEMSPCSSELQFMAVGFARQSFSCAGNLASIVFDQLTQSCIIDKQSSHTALAYK